MTTTRLEPRPRETSPATGAEAATLLLRVESRVAHPTGLRQLRRRLRTALAVLPSPTRTVVVDLGAIDLVTVDVVVVLCVERRSLAARGVELRLDLPAHVPTSPGVEHLLRTLQIRPDPTPSPCARTPKEH